MEAINRKFKDAHKYTNNWVWMYAFSLCYILFSGLIGFYSVFAIFTCIPLVLAIIFTVQRMMICKSDPNIGMNKMQIIELTIHTLFLIGFTTYSFLCVHKISNRDGSEGFTISIDLAIIFIIMLGLYISFVTIFYYLVDREMIAENKIIYKNIIAEKKIMKSKKSILDYVYYYELTYGGYCEKKEDDSYEEELNKIYNSNKDKKCIFDILKNNIELRYLIFAFPHEAHVKHSYIDNDEYILELDLTSSFSKPLYNGVRQEQVKMIFKLACEIQFDKVKQIESKLTQRYDVEIMEQNHYKFSLECSNDSFEGNESIEFEFSGIDLIFD
ncbi:MAG: hypothetical protein K6E87_04105 [bacterium]|nr:hypothetical protein [bacterium]